MNSLLRSIHCVVETNIIPLDDESFKNKKVFQLIKYITGKNNSGPESYIVNNHDSWYGYDTVVIEGKKGFIRLALQPLFEVIDCP